MFAVPRFLRHHCGPRSHAVLSMVSLVDCMLAGITIAICTKKLMFRRMFNVGRL